MNGRGSAQRRAVWAFAFAATACGGGVDFDVDGGASDSGATNDGGAFDAGTFFDGGAFDAGPFDAGLVPPVRYVAGTTHSPLTPAVAAGLQRMAARAPGRRGDVFSKVGDSNTVNTNHLACFAGTQVDFGAWSALSPTRDVFKAALVESTTPFDRVSLAATVGWRVDHALAGTPNAVAREVALANPRFATVAFGTNDVGLKDPFAFGKGLWSLVDSLVSAGVVPIVSSMPPRDDDATVDVWVPRYNAVARAVAQARQVPFVDLHRELLALPSHGLGPDGVHLNVYTPAGSARGCVLTDAGTVFGHNRRNAVVLEALSLARRAVLDAGTATLSAPVLEGQGSASEPFVVDSLPFVDGRSTADGGTRSFGSYPPCSPADESGAEYVYRFNVTKETSVRAMVVAQGLADVDVHVLSGQATASSCTARDDKVLTATLSPGTWYFVVDTYVAQGAARSGDYLFVVMREP